MQERVKDREKMMKVQLKSKIKIINKENIEKIVALSDTHIPVRAAKIPEQIIKEFKDADLIVHAGDFQTIEVVNNLESYNNFIGVQGNMDSDDVAKKLPEKVIVNIKNNEKDFKIGIMHGFGPKEGIEERVLKYFEEKVDCIIFGHSHDPLNKTINNTLLFNPGSATDTIFTTVNTFGILNINNEIKAKIVRIK